MVTDVFFVLLFCTISFCRLAFAALDFASSLIGSAFGLVWFFSVMATTFFSSTVFLFMASDVFSGFCAFSNSFGRGGAGINESLLERPN